MKNILLYFSAFIPMYLLILVKFVVALIAGSIEFNFLTLLTIIIYSSLIILGIVGFFWNYYGGHESKTEITIITQHNITDQHFMGYFSLFVLFALTFELTRISMFVVSILIIIFIGIVYVNNKMFYINPFLNLLGFNFYEITYKIKDEDKENTAKMFYRGTIQLNKTYLAKIKNRHFSFVINPNK